MIKPFVAEPCYRLTELSCRRGARVQVDKRPQQRAASVARLIVQLVRWRCAFPCAGKVKAHSLFKRSRVKAVLPTCAPAAIHHASDLPSATMSMGSYAAFVGHHLARKMAQLGISRAQNVAVALSGGADSLSLALAVSIWQKSTGQSSFQMYTRSGVY